MVHFYNELIRHYDDIKSDTFIIQLINLPKKDIVIEHIQQFHKLRIMVKKIPKDLLYLFMCTLKENIQHEVHFFEPKSL